MTVEQLTLATASCERFCAAALAGPATYAAHLPTCWWLQRWDAWIRTRKAGETRPGWTR